MSKKLTTEEFITRAKQVHGDKYDYSKVIYHGMEQNIIIICSIHKEFKQQPNNHLMSRGCPYCANNQISNIDEFIQKALKIHGTEYDYSEFIYVNAITKSNIICHKIDENGNEHGKFEQSPNHHISKKQGCPKCYNKSHLEKDIQKFLITQKINYVTQYIPTWFQNGKSHQSLDFYLPDYNIAIECQGKQHFEPVFFFGGDEALKYTVIKDITKFQLCQKNNIKLLYFTTKRYKQYVNNYIGKLFIDKNKLLEEINNIKNED